MKTTFLADRFKGRGPLINIVLDGWGIGSHNGGDAVFLARTPNMDRLTDRFAHSSLLTHGPYVGLPSINDIGGSEVGHLTLGAGKTFPQGPTRIKELIDKGEFSRGEVLNRLIDQCLEKSSALHLIGLLSDGSVHSHISHFYTVINLAVQRGVTRLFVHALLDGRDVPYQSALEYIEPLENRFEAIRRNHPGWDYRVASGGGREVITMDRDTNWEKVRLGWQVHVHGREGAHFSSAAEAVQTYRAANPDMADQEITPFVVVKDGKPAGPIQDGDSVIFMNFRGDRAMEFSQAMVLDDFKGFDRGRRPTVLYAGMMVYDEDTNMPPLQLMPPASVDNPFGRRVLELGMDQFRLAETQKYAHVTFFFNGGYREPLDPKKETYHLIPSDRIQSYADAPAMKAADIAKKAADFIRSGRFQYGLINFANSDMVGHTGNLAAAIQAVEAVDGALGILLEAVEAVDGLALITADHGNADEMVSYNPVTKKTEPNTRHSINPVPVVIFDPHYRGPEDYTLLQPDKDHPNTLSMVAATNFILLGRTPPDDLNRHLFT
ncbi:MAG: 2,3-bisphosphoglycerate-independent phosphoglycerate mutase [Deltaproteobacteria bacterium]|nr:2,3-bisphosphoglycerate-independent phosphoglycerate mutase [Deltaproteobacteria bacterium]